MFVFRHGEDTLGTGEGLRDGMAGSGSLFSALGRAVFPTHSLLCKMKKRMFMSPFTPLWCSLAFYTQTIAHCNCVCCRAISIAAFEVVLTRPRHLATSLRGVLVPGIYNKTKQYEKISLTSCHPFLDVPYFWILVF